MQVVGKLAIRGRVQYYTASDPKHSPVIVMNLIVRIVSRSHCACTDPRLKCN